MGKQTEREIVIAAHKEYMKKPLTWKERAIGILIAAHFVSPAAVHTYYHLQEKSVPAVSQSAQLKGELKAAKDKIEKTEVSASAPVDASTQ